MKVLLSNRPDIIPIPEESKFKSIHDFNQILDLFSF